MKRLYIILCLIFSLLLFPGCGQKPTPVSTTPQQTTTTTQPAADSSKQSQTVAPASNSTTASTQQTDSSTNVQPSTKAPETTKPAPAPEKKQTVTVYVTNTGSKYHSNGCQYLRKSCIPISLDKAKAQGYGPCSKCGPPQ